jgi:hypothetical protein
LHEDAECTVCIPTHNQSRYLREAVRSVAEQTAPVRLLVSNDASPDDTAEVIAELQRQYRFQAVNHPVNMGISTNLQWMLRQPQTRFIMRLDSDDLIYPEYIRELTELLEEYPQAGYAHCAVDEIDAEGRRAGGRQLARLQAYQDAEEGLRRSVKGYQVTANVLVFRREALKSVDFGGGSAELNFVEDYDLSVRLADAGWGNAYSGRTLAAYRMWSGLSRPVARRKLTEVRGVEKIFTGSLQAAFARRGWPPEPLNRRRVELALANSEVLDRAVFEPGQREEMEEALLRLGGHASLKRVFAAGAAGYLMRRTYFLAGEARRAVKRGIKRILLHRPASAGS